MEFYNFIHFFSIFRGKVTRMYFFILHLSIADLLTAIGTLLPEFFWTFTYPKFYGGNVGCKLMKYCFMVREKRVKKSIDNYIARKWDVSCEMHCKYKHWKYMGRAFF